MKKLVLVVVLLFNSVFAQYSSEDYELVKSIYQRDFNNPIIIKYLHSTSTQQVNAALLGISHSSEQKFISEIIKLDFSKYGKYITFALGQLGESPIAAKYLMEKLFLTANKKFQKELMEALSKIGSQSDLKEIINYYFDKQKNSFEGISIALVNFYYRKITDQRSHKVIKEELKSSSALRKLEALFALYSIKPTEKFLPQLRKVILAQGSHRNNRLKNYAFASLLRLKKFNFSKKEIQLLYGNKNWTIRYLTLRSLYLSGLNNNEKLDLYLEGIKDDNPNISRLSASMLKNVNFENSLKNEVIIKIENILQDLSLSINTKGELFTSLCKLDSNNIYKHIDFYKNKIEKIFFIQALNYNNHYEKNIKIFLEMKKSANKIELLEIYNSLLKIQKKNKSGEIEKIFIEALSSQFPAGISVIADGIEDSFIKTNAKNIEAIIKMQVTKYIDDSDFMESLISLAKLSDKISKSFGKQISQELTKSKLYSIQSYASKKLSQKKEVLKPVGNFNKIWEEAFKYRGASVSTNKGTFTIMFNSQVAPISIGSFCMLAEKKYFNDIIFHRVVPNFVIQTGDPTNTGWGGPGYEIISELSEEPFYRGTVGMASAGKDTEGSQWFVIQNDVLHLNRRYTNFGKIADGENVIGQIEQGDVITNIKLIK